MSDKLLVDDGELRVFKRHVPLGVVGSITPWNWPLLIAIWHIVPAIRAGNTVVLKPSPFTPLATARMVELIQDVLPPGVINLVTGDADVGGAMTSHPKIRKIVFTGSTATGQHVMRAAASDMKRLTLELGGNDAAIVLPGTAIGAILPGLFFGSFINAGQTCGAIKRLYVHDRDYQNVCDALADFASKQKAGNGLEPDTIIGPVQNKPQWEKVKTFTKAAIKDGATLLTGGEQVGKGYCLTPAIVADARQEMDLVRFEQFGPVLPVIRYSDVDEGVRQCNDSIYGLCASVWGSNPDDVAAVSDRLEAGIVYRNTHAELHPFVPFGGHKCSGLGVQFGEEGLASFTDSRAVFERVAPPGSG